MTQPRLKSNLAILVLGDAAGKLINVFVFSRLGRILEPAAYGQLEFVLGAIFVGALIVEAGLGPWGARAVARDPEGASRILGRVMVLRAMILVGVLVVIGIFAATLGLSGAGARGVLLVTAALMLVPRTALCEWLFQGRNEMPTVTATTLLEPLMSLAGTVAFVSAPEHLVRVPFILAAATATVAFVQQVTARARGVRPEFRHGLDAAGTTLKESLPLGLSTLAWAVRFFAPLLAMGFFARSDEVGAFGAAHRLTVSMHAIVWLYFFNLLPVWARRGGEGTLARSVTRSLIVTLGLAALLVVTVFLFAPLIAAKQLYGNAYASSVSVLRILALVPALAWISGNFRFGLIAMGALKAELIANVAGAGVVLCILAGLAHDMTAMTATYAFCLAEMATLVTAWWCWRLRAFLSKGAVPPTTAGEPAAELPR